MDEGDAEELAEMSEFVVSRRAGEKVAGSQPSLMAGEESSVDGTELPRLASDAAAQGMRPRSPGRRAEPSAIRCASIRTTVLPDLFNRTAAVKPVMPPPMIATSAEMSSGIAG
jgi:hypothetical protein